MLTCAVLVSAPKGIRMLRVRERSRQKFGDRMLPGGDLYEREEQFFDMIGQRSEKDVTKWLNSVKIPVIRVNGMQTVEKSVKMIERILLKN